MYTKREREGILWEFHRSGLTVRQACDTLRMFPTRQNLCNWLRMEEAGELVAKGMPDRVARMHCAHGEGGDAYANRRPRGGRIPSSGDGGRRPGLADVERLAGQTDWRDWGADLPEGPAGRARTAEVKLAEALAVLDVPKAPGPGSLTGAEKFRAGEAARAASPLVRLADVCETLAIPKSAYGDQRARLGRPDPKGPPGERARASFEAGGGAYGSGGAAADLRSGPGEPVSWRDLADGDMGTPVIATGKVVRAVMAEEGLVARQAAEVRRRARHDGYRGELAERPANLPLREDGTHGLAAPEPGPLAVTDVTEFAPDGLEACLSPATGCLDGWPACWRLSRRPDKGLVVGMLGGLAAAVAPTAERPPVAHGDGGAACMTEDWREACEAGHVARPMSGKARSPDNARCEGFFGTPESDSFDGRDWSGVTFEEFSERLDGYIE